MNTRRSLLENMLPRRLVSRFSLFVFVLGTVCAVLSSLVVVVQAWQENRDAVRAVRLVGVGGRDAGSISSVGKIAWTVPHLGAVALAWQGPPSDAEAYWLSDRSTASELKHITGLAMANAYFARGFDEAGQQMLRRVPNSWRWAYGSGYYHVQRQEWQQAHVWLERAMAADLGLSAEKAYLYRDVCNMRRHFGDFEGALRACEMFMQVAGSEVEPYTYSGFVYVEAGDFRTALHVLEAGLARGEPTSWHYILMGRASAGIGDWDTARGWYGRALEMNKADPIANLYMGLLMMDMGETDEAVPYLELAIHSPETYYSNLARQALSKIRSEGQEP